MKKSLTSKEDTFDTKKINFEAKMTQISYSVSTIYTHTDGALIDRGANGGIASGNLRVITRTDRAVDINGIDNHQVRDLNIVTTGGVVTTQCGLTIAIFHQMAHSPLGRTIVSSLQLEHFKNKVDDRSIHVQGEQSIRNIMPLSFHQGLPYLEIRPFSDVEYQNLPHVIMTSDAVWDPSIMDVDRDNSAWLVGQPDINGV